ncbi:hypothetical protein BDP27DRAFT_1445839 [Rhodocollybia butyracea]|uniref:Uncharacterized protein n=1 Tax=Rhodocollybia butyracea TaxID=206335 RepID=A0A9P5Q210_9AGAR|nr:hypothetical protein BDP27DRAFT_1445839 [Rhodocollybia butyracea]
MVVAQAGDVEDDFIVHSTGPPTSNSPSTPASTITTRISPPPVSTTTSPTATLEPALTLSAPPFPTVPTSTIPADSLSTTTFFPHSGGSASTGKCPPKDTQTVSAGPIAGIVVGAILVLAIAIFICMYRRRRGRRRQQMEARRVSPLQPAAHADADLSTTLTLDPVGEKSHHNRDSGILLVPNPPWQAESTLPTSEFPHPELPPTFPSSSYFTPTSTSTQVQEDVNVKVVRMEATMGRMAEQIRHLESQLVMTGDGDSYSPPPTYISS